MPCLMIYTRLKPVSALTKRALAFLIATRPTTRQRDARARYSRRGGWRPLSNLEAGLSRIPIKTERANHKFALLASGSLHERPVTIHEPPLYTAPRAVRFLTC